MVVINWIKDKLGSINSIVDIGVILTIISGLILLLVFIWKLTIMNLIGVPLTISIDVVDIRTIDFVITFLSSVIFFILAIISYTTIYIQPWKKRIINTIIMSIIMAMGMKVFKLSLYEVFIRTSVYTIYLLMLSVIIWYIKSQSNKKVEQTINQIYNEKNEFQKLIVAISETLIKLAPIVIMVLVVGNLYLIIPSDKKVIKNKVVLYSANNYYLVAEYSVMNKKTHKQINANFNMLEIIHKEENVIITIEKFACYKLFRE